MKNISLTIQPGVVVKVNNALGIQVGSPEGFGPGALVAIGTVAQPILFTSNDPTPIAGKWNNILFTDLAVDATFNGAGVYQSGSILDHVIVEFAGGGSATTGAVTVLSASPAINAAEIRLSARSGIRVDATASPSMRITNCDLHDNVANGQSGGGVYLLNGQGHLLNGNSIHNNGAPNGSGGGVYLQNVSAASLTANTIASNSASSGGGIFATQGVNLFLKNNAITGNNASSYGGMYTDGAGIQIRDGSFSGNGASSHAALYCSSNNATVDNVVFSGNIASGPYGGSYISGANASITGSQWTGNTASSRGGLHVDGTGVTFSNNLVANNQAIGANSDFGGLEFGGNSSTISGNTIQGNSCQRNSGGVGITGNAITLDLVKEALKDMLAVENRLVSVENIQKVVADFYKIKVADMHSKKRTRNIARPRQVAMALAKELTQMSLPAIGEAFGGRDHTTVLHACRTVADLRESDMQIKHDFQVLMQMIKG